MFLNPRVLRRCPALPLVRLRVQMRCLQTSGYGLRQRYRKTHYETLGLTSNASQADIKSAYYKLSMKYHPDKNKGAEEKFKDITQAYEVLGNPRMRRLYDRGIISHNDDEDAINQYSETNTPTSESMGDHTEASRVSATNYDQWSKHHTSHAFNRTQEAKRNKSRSDEVKYRKKEDSSAETFLWLLFGLGLILIGYSKVGRSTNSKKEP